MLKARDYLDYKISMLRDSMLEKTGSDDAFNGADITDWRYREMHEAIIKGIHKSLSELEKAAFAQTYPDLVPKTDDICDENQSNKP